MKEDTVNKTKIDVPKLNDTNYNDWSNAMETLLSAKGLYQHCLNEKAVAMKDLLNYFNNDQKCKGILGLHVESRYYPLIKSSKTAYQAWTKLKEECVSVKVGIPDVTDDHVEYPKQPEVNPGTLHEALRVLHEELSRKR